MMFSVLTEYGHLISTVAGPQHLQVNIWGSSKIGMVTFDIQSTSSVRSPVYGQIHAMRGPHALCVETVRNRLSYGMLSTLIFVFPTPRRSRTPLIFRGPRVFLKTSVIMMLNSGNQTYGSVFKIIALEIWGNSCVFPKHDVIREIHAFFTHCEKFMHFSHFVRNSRVFHTL